MLAVDLGGADGMVGGVEGTSCILEHYSECALNPKTRRARNRAPANFWTHAGNFVEFTLNITSTQAQLKLRFRV